jgi:inositol transport system substrate-binding protein
MKRLLVVALSLVVIATSLFAQSGQAITKKGKKIVVGYTFHSAQDVFQNIVKNAFLEAAAAKGVEVKVIDPQMDIEKQVTAVETFVSLGVDAIVCSPLDFQGAIPGVLAANSAHIPYVAVNSEVGGGDFVYVGSRHYDSGAIQGEYMAKVLPKGAKIVYLRGTEGMSHTRDRRKGVQDMLLDKRPDVQLLAEQTANYDRVQAMKVMEDWIQPYPKIDGVLAANDQMALGALEALKAAHRDRGVYIAGIDGTDEAKQNVAKGIFSMTVLQDAKGQASAALDAALKLIAGEKVPKVINVPYKPLTPENIKKYM